VADESGSGPRPEPTANTLAAFLAELLQGSPHPSLGPNDPPEWRRERAREQLLDWGSRVAYGKSVGEVQPTDILAAILSVVPVGRFAPAARGASGTIAAGARAARSADVGELARSLRSPLIDPPLPTHTPPTGGYRFGVVPTGDLLRYGKRPAVRTQGLAGLLERIIESVLAATQSPPDPPPGSVNPAVMP
jgi:hypothetical protein